MLPTIETPKYSVTIPSTKKTVEIRPYRVKEEKILMIAIESADEKQIMMAVKDIIRGCTFDKVNPDELTTTDLEYLFLKLRAKSVGENVSITLKCQEKDCIGQIEMDIDLDSIEPVSTGNGFTSNKIELSNTIGMTLRPITIRTLGKLNANTKDDDKGQRITNAIIATIDTIYDDKGVYRADDYSISDMTKFVDSLSAAHVKQIQSYIETQPQLSKVVNYTCPKCKKKHSLTLKGLQSFFV